MARQHAIGKLFEKSLQKDIIKNISTDICISIAKGTQMLLFLTMIDSDDEKKLFVRIYNLYKGLMYYKAFQIIHNAEDA